MTDQNRKPAAAEPDAPNNAAATTATVPSIRNSKRSLTKESQIFAVLYLEKYTLEETLKKVHSIFGTSRELEEIKRLPELLHAERIDCPCIEDTEGFSWHKVLKAALEEREFVNEFSAFVLNYAPRSFSRSDTGAACTRRFGYSFRASCSQEEITSILRQYRGNPGRLAVIKEVAKIYPWYQPPRTPAVAQSQLQSYKQVSNITDEHKALWALHVLYGFTSYEDLLLELEHTLGLLESGPSLGVIKTFHNQIVCQPALMAEWIQKARTYVWWRQDDRPPAEAFQRQTRVIKQIEARQRKRMTHEAKAAMLEGDQSRHFRLRPTVPEVYISSETESRPRNRNSTRPSSLVQSSSSSSSQPSSPAMKPVSKQGTEDSPVRSPPQTTSRSPSAPAALTLHPPNQRPTTGQLRLPTTSVAPPLNPSPPTHPQSLRSSSMSSPVDTSSRETPPVPSTRPNQYGNYMAAALNAPTLRIVNQQDNYSVMIAQQYYRLRYPNGPLPQPGHLLSRGDRDPRSWQELLDLRVIQSYGTKDNMVAAYRDARGATFDVRSFAQNPRLHQPLVPATTPRTMTSPAPLLVPPRQRPRTPESRPPQSTNLTPNFALTSFNNNNNNSSTHSNKPKTTNDGKAVNFLFPQTVHRPFEPTAQTTLEQERHNKSTARQRRMSASKHLQVKTVKAEVVDLISPTSDSGSLRSASPRSGKLEQRKW